MLDKLDALLVCVDACRTRLERVPQFIDRFRQAVLASATSGQLTADRRLKQKSVSLDDEGEIGFDFADANQFDDYRFPASWKPVRLGEIAEIAGGVTKDTKKQDSTDEEF